MKPVKNTSPGLPYRIGDLITPNLAHACTYRILNLTGEVCEAHRVCPNCYNSGKKLARLHCLQLHTKDWYCLQHVGLPWIILERRAHEPKRRTIRQG